MVLCEVLISMPEIRNSYFGERTAQILVKREED